MNLLFEPYGAMNWFKRVFVALKETIEELNELLGFVVKDLEKAHRGNKTASQRVRVGTIHLEKIGKLFRKESVAAEKGNKRRAFKGKNKKKRRFVLR